MELNLNLHDLDEMVLGYSSINYIVMNNDTLLTKNTINLSYRNNKSLFKNIHTRICNKAHHSCNSPVALNILPLGFSAISKRK